MREWRLANVYGITLEQYDALVERQGGVCAICQRPPAEGKNLDVDHDHACCPDVRRARGCGGCVRGLLCKSCNSGLHIVEQPDKHQRALAYLGRDA
jgi:hypothetical protein